MNNATNILESPPLVSIPSSDLLGRERKALKWVKEHPSISQREKNILIWRFGLEDGYERTLQEIGNTYKVTRERIRQIEANALQKLRNYRPTPNSAAAGLLSNDNKQSGTPAPFDTPKN